jgi:K+/H+ antiporter YhaU regulatory subunit KhtT
MRNLKTGAIKVNPDPATKITEDDSLMVLGSEQALARLRAHE